MALTTEQQSQIDLEEARLGLNDTENTKQQKLEAVRMAQSIVNENRRLTSAADATDVTVSQITSIADDLLTYINA